MSNLFQIILSTFLALLASSVKHFAPHKTIITDGASLSNQTFDIIIVGGGLSGLTLANRLSTNLPAQKILVIEAGDDTRKDDNVTSYLNVDRTYRDTHINWAFETVPQVHGNISNSLSMILDAGKGLGGGTSINGGLYDTIFEAQTPYVYPDNREEFVKGMKKSQNFHIPSKRQMQSGGANYDPKVHDTGGLVDLAFSKSMYLGPHQHAFNDSIINASNNLTANVDHANGDNVGVGVLPHAIIPDNENQTRVSSATAFLTPIEDRQPNLTVLTGWRAIKIEWAASFSQRKRAGGVTIQKVRNGTTYEILLSKKRGQVIVSAGTILSPFFLEHSGIGAPEVLSRAGIGRQVSLPGVGKNLQEQAFNLVILPRNTSIDMQGTGPPSIKAMLNATNIFSAERLETLECDIRREMHKWADEMVSTGAVASKAGLMAQYEAQVTGIFEQGWPVAEVLFQPKFDETIFAAGPNMALQTWILVPFSRGKTHANSTSAWDTPELDPKFWSAKFDMEAQVAAMRLSRRTLENRRMKELSFGEKLEVQPGYNTVPDSTSGGSSECWVKYIHNNYLPVAHPVGTCSMLSQNKGGVVDKDFKVYGTDNVRVVDASVIPMEVTSHLCGTLYALTEKAADIILQQSSG